MTRPNRIFDIFLKFNIYWAAGYWQTMNRMNCLYDLILFFNILVQAEVVVSVVLSLFVRESFVGKFLDPLAAARVVQVSRPLHQGLGSAKYPTILRPWKGLVPGLVKFVPAFANQAGTDFTKSCTSHFRRPSIFILRIRNITLYCSVLHLARFPRVLVAPFVANCITERMCLSATEYVIQFSLLIF